MPNASCLHIQDRESGPIRVLEIPWISLRIGRAAYCEVRLADVEIPPEACRLQRRGRMWQIVPSARGASVLLAGQPVHEPAPLPYDMPFCIGGYRLTLREDRTAAPLWDTYERPEPASCAGGLSPFEAVTVPEAPDSLESIRVAWRPSGPGKELADRPRPEPPPPQAKPARPPADLRNDWEKRWREAGAQIKARPELYKAAPEPGRPTYDAPGGGALDEKLRLHGPDQALTRFSRLRTDRSDRTRLEGQPFLLGLDEARAEAARDQNCEGEVPGHCSLGDSNENLAEAPEGAAPAAAPPYQGGEIAEALQSEPIITPDSPSFEPEALAELQTVEAPGALEAPAERELLTGSGGSSPTAEAEAFSPALAQAEDQSHSESEIVASAQGARDEVVASTPPFVPAGVEQGPGDSLGPKRVAGRTHRDEEVRSATLLPGGLVAAAHGTSSRRGKQDAAPDRLEWPSARDILASHRARPGPRASAPAARRVRRGSLPTRAREPGQWILSAWLAGPPLALFGLVVGTSTLVFSWWWASDAYSASVMTDRLMAANPAARRRPLPDWVVPPVGNWTRTTGQHLAHWAIFLSGLDEEEKTRYPADAPALLGLALAASPINATARLAHAQIEPRQSDSSVTVGSLGLSRDVLSVAWSARRLASDGKRQAALEMYRRALAIAEACAPARAAAPRFNDDPGVPRYLLPGEENVRDILRELISRNDWAFGEWSEVLPRNTVVPLAAARLLREQGRRESEALLDKILEEPGPLGGELPAEAVLVAARAEALAMHSRWKEAVQEYKKAIELAGNDTIRRSWWFNLADVASRLDDEGQQQSALRCALASATRDDISRRATELQRGTTGRNRPRASGAKAN